MLDRKHLKKMIAIISIGVLSLAFAEFFSGSNPIWYRTGSGYLFVLPIYLTHSLFYINIAYHRKTFSFKGLYVLGMMFGLYEGLITRVLWVGYPNEDGAIFGTLLDVAWFEYATLIIFWHPLMALMVPMMIFMMMSGERIEGLSFSKTTLAAISLVLFGGIFLHAALVSNMRVIIESILVHIIIIIGMMMTIKRLSIQLEDLILSKRSVWILLGFMVLGVYVPFWFFYDTFTVRPSWLGMITYLVSWLGIILFYIKRVKRKPIELIKDEHGSLLAKVIGLGGLMLVWILVLNWFLFLVVPMSLIMFLALPIFGVVLLVFVSAKLN